MTSYPTGVAVATMLALSMATLAGCSTEQVADTPRIEEKTFALKSATVPLRIGVLTGQLTDLSVLQRVNAETGEVVYAPQLRGSLKLKNTSADQAVRLVNGEIEFLDAAGAPITLAGQRGAATFQFYGYGADRLDPGMETTHGVDVPFPAAALNGTALTEIRLNVTYIPAPYREESATLPVALAERR